MCHQRCVRNQIERYRKCSLKNMTALVKLLLPDLKPDKFRPRLH